MVSVHRPTAQRVRHPVGKWPALVLGEANCRTLLILAAVSIVPYYLIRKSGLATGHLRLHNAVRYDSATSKLFPPALDMMKRGMPLENAYGCFDETTSFSLSEAQEEKSPPRAGLEGVNIQAEAEALSERNVTSCTCEDPPTTPEGKNPLCCQRRIFSGHKMGTFLQMSWEEEMKRHGIQKGDFDHFPDGRDIPYAKDHLLQPAVDFRDVMILRNLYDSIISGYLYHREGKECWLDWWGNDGSWDPNIFPSFYTRRWMRYIDLTSQTTEPYPTLCHALANETEANGMRIYVDWVFHAFYGKTFEFWALSSGWDCPSIQRRVRTFCFEDLASKTDAKESLASMVEFLTDGAASIAQSADVEEKQEANEETTKKEYDGGHSTSHDPNLRQRLLGIIKDIDGKHYNSDIAWLHSALPCR